MLKGSPAALVEPASIQQAVASWPTFSLSSFFFLGASLLLASLVLFLLSSRARRLLARPPVNSASPSSATSSSSSSSSSSRMSSHPPLHPSGSSAAPNAAATASNDALIDSLSAGGMSGGSLSAPSSPSRPQPHPIGVPRLGLGPLGLMGMAMGHASHIPSSPVSPMPEGGDAPAHTLRSAKELLGAMQQQAAAQQMLLAGKDVPAGSGWSVDETGDESMTPSAGGGGSNLTAAAPPSGGGAQEEEIAADDEEDGGLGAASPAAWTGGDALSAEDMLADLGDAAWLEEYEEEEVEAASPKAASPPPAAAPLSREEKLALEEKAKTRRKFAEMRYLCNSMFRCQDCMLAPTNMEQGFDEHAPPVRPAARPSAGPGSQYCCVYPALVEALPADFAADLIPIIHSYLLSDAPSRSWLTTPPLPSQGTIQCFIMKRDSKFELYLEMKNQETFVKMRAAQADKEAKKKSLAIERQRKRQRRKSGGDDADQDVDMEAAEAEANATEANAAAASAPSAAAASSSSSSSSASSSLPGVPPILVSANSVPTLGSASSSSSSSSGLGASASQAPVTSLDDSELGLRTPRTLPGPSPSPLGDPLETPAELRSPTHSLDYENLFPEPQARKVTRKRRVLRPVEEGKEGMSEHSLAAQPRRMSEPAIGASAAAARARYPTRRAAAAAAASSSIASTSSSSGASSKAPTPGSVARRLSASGLSSSSSNLSLHTTRSNAVNRMLKEHAERMIAEGKDIFLLCAQRKRSWTGNAYVISSDRDNLRAEGPSFYGKLKSNFGGTEFVATDNGVKSPSRRQIEKLQTHTYPTYTPDAPKAEAQQQRSGVSAWLGGAGSQSPHVRHELATVLYDHFYEHTGSPIRIKVLLPNRHFDLHAEAAVGGSILKQHRMEVERAEKRKLEAEARAQQAEESRKKSEAAKAEQAGGSDVVMSDASAPSLGSSGDAQAPAASTLTSSSSSSSSSSGSSSSSSLGVSAAVAPAIDGALPDVPASSEPNAVDCYENLRPVWHDGMNAYVLHFDHHRVREKSVKNFLIKREVPDPDNPGQTLQKTVLQFGRVLDRNIFIMDFGYPLSPLAAFAICLSSIDPKLAV